MALEKAYLMQLEALLFARGDLIDKDELYSLFPSDVKLDELLETLEKNYMDRGIRLVCVNNSWGFRTAPDCASVLQKWQEKPMRLSQAALEILIICAYHQPISRAEIESIRGTAVSSSILNKLMSLGWVKPQGRRSLPGRPLLWQTTQAFLEHFDLDSLDHLPSRNEIRTLGFADNRQEHHKETNLFTIKEEQAS